MQQTQVGSIESVQVDLLDIFMDMTTEDSEKIKADSAKRKLEARRAIEQHYELKELQHRISEYWFDDEEETPKEHN